jgi:hypothetical protein
VRLLAEAPAEQVIDVLGDVAAPAVADPDERGKLAYLLARPRVRADKRAEQFQGTLRLLLAEPADEQLQPLPRCHMSSLTASAIICRSQGCQAKDECPGTVAHAPAVQRLVMRTVRYRSSSGR